MNFVDKLKNKLDQKSDLFSIIRFIIPPYLTES